MRTADIKSRLARIDREVDSRPTAEELEKLSPQEKYLRMLNDAPPPSRIEPALNLTPAEAYQRMIGGACTCSEDCR